METKPLSISYNIYIVYFKCIEFLYNSENLIFSAKTSQMSVNLDLKVRDLNHFSSNPYSFYSSKLYDFSFFLRNFS